MSWSEYLAFEETSDVRHEYHDGELYAMVGNTQEHVLLTGAVQAALRAHLRGGPCLPYASDFKVRIKPANRAMYPDVVVACEASLGDTYATNVPLIFEVLSKSTEAFDRGDKCALYQLLPSFREYVLVDTKAVSVDHFSKTEEGVWTQRPRLGPGGLLKLASIGLTIAVSDIYEDSGIG